MQMATLAIAARCEQKGIAFSQNMRADNQNMYQFTGTKH